jgi:hypothetical protein
MAGITHDAADRLLQRPGARVRAHPQACRAMRTRAALSRWPIRAEPRLAAPQSAGSSAGARRGRRKGCRTHWRATTRSTKQASHLGRRWRVFETGW